MSEPINYYGTLASLLEDYKRLKDENLELRAEVNRKADSVSYWHEVYTEQRRLAEKLLRRLDLVRTATEGG